MSTPRFSIITATFNRAPLLREAIESVRAQGRDDIEHLIIDAASTDGTRELLAEHPDLRVISEPDRGIYDAFNKGLALARGEIVHFLNSDDLFVPGALDAVAGAFREDVDLVSGGVEFFERAADGAELVLRRDQTEAELAFTVPQVLLGLPALNARFFRRRLIERIGNFDLRYTIAADREFLLRAALLRPRGEIVRQLVYRYRSHAGSLTVHETARNIERMWIEHVELCEHHLATVAEDRAALVALHRRESAALAVDCALSGRWAETQQWVQRGCAISASWPLAFFKRCGGRMLGRASRYALAPQGWGSR